MYKMTKNEIEMYVTTIHNAYPEAPEAAMEAMRKRFSDLQLADNFLAEAHEKMNMLDTAILINNLSRNHLTTEMAFDVIKHFDDKCITSQIHSQWPDEQMEERINVIATWYFKQESPVIRIEPTRHISKHKPKKMLKMPTFISHLLKPSVS